MRRDTQTPKGDGVCGETTLCAGRKSHNSGGTLVPSERRRPPQKSRTQEGVGDMCPRLENGWPPRRVVEAGRAGRRCRSLPRHVARPDPPVPPLGFSRGAGPEIAEGRDSLANGGLRTSGGGASGHWQGEASSPFQGLEGLMVGEQNCELMASLRSVSTDAGRSNPSLSVTKRPDQSEFKRLVGVGHSFCRETREQETRDDDDNDAVVIAVDDESVGDIFMQQGGRVTEKKMSSSKRIINGAVHSAHNERRATTVISSSVPTPRTPSSKVFISSMAFTAPQETLSETASGTASPCVHNVGSGDFTSMGRYANQAQKTGFGDSNGPSSELVLKRGDKFAAMNGVVMDEANCDPGSGTRSSTPQQPQRFAPQQLPFAGGADFCSSVVYGDVSRDRVQNVGGSGGRPVAGMSARASSQQQQQQQQQHLQRQQGHGLTHTTPNKMMTSTSSGSPWSMMPVYDFVSCLTMYVNTCLRLGERDRQARYDFVTRIQRIVTKTIGPSAEVRVHGSMTTDLALPSSDIDLLVVGYEPLSPLQAIQRVSQAIYQIEDHELRELEVKEAKEAENSDAGVAVEEPFPLCRSDGLDGDAEEVSVEKYSHLLPTTGIEDAMLMPEGELDSADPIMRVEEEEAEYRSQIERDYFLSRRAGLTSAAMASSLPPSGGNTTAMMFHSYMNSFSTPLHDTMLPSFMAGGDGGVGAVESLAPIFQPPSTPGYRLYVPTLDGPLFQVQTIISTRVPVIKVTEKSSGMKGDITFAGGEHWRSLKLTNHLLRQYPMARGLILFLKHCVRQMGMGDSQPGGVTSFAIYLMVLHFFNEAARHTEEILQRERLKEDQQDEGETGDVQIGNEKAAAPGGVGDNSSTSGGVKNSGSCAAVSRTQSPLASSRAIQISPFLSSQPSYVADRFSALELALKQRFALDQQTRDGKHNTANIARSIFDFVGEEDVPRSGEDDGEIELGSNLVERTGAKLVTPHDNDTALVDNTRFGQAQHHADATTIPTELHDGTAQASEHTDNNSDADEEDSEVYDDDHHSVTAELKHANDGEKDENCGKGTSEEECKVAGNAQGDESNLPRVTVLRLLSSISLGYLFHDFCFYYGFVFDYDNHGLSFDPSGNSQIVQKPRKCQQRGQHLYMTSPFDEQYDITARMLHTREFQELCCMFVPITAPIATLSDYNGSVCTLHQALEWISPETAVKELMEVHAAFQKQQQQLQQQQQRVDTPVAPLGKTKEQLSLATFSESSRKVSPSTKVDKRDQQVGCAHSLPASNVDDTSIQEDRLLCRRGSGLYKNNSGNNVVAESRNKTDRVATEIINDAVAPATGASRGSVMSRSTTPCAEPRNSETTRSRSTTTTAAGSATRRLGKRGEGTLENLATLSGGSAAAASSVQSATATAALPPSPSSGTPVMSAALPVPGVPGSGTVNPVTGESVMTRCQHPRQQAMQQQQQQQQQQLPLGFPPQFNMCFFSPGGSGNVHPGLSPYYLPMSYSPEAMLHHHHHQHYSQHQFGTPFPYLGYKLSQLHHQHPQQQQQQQLQQQQQQQQRAVYDVVNSHSHSGSGVGVGSALNRQGNARGNVASPQSGRARGRSGTHRGTGTNNSNHGEKSASVKGTAPSFLGEPPTTGEGKAGDNNNSNVVNSMATGTMSEASLTCKRSQTSADAKERPQVENSSLLMQETHHYQPHQHSHHHPCYPAHHHHHHHHHYHYYYQQQQQQQLLQFSPHGQHHLHPNNLKSWANAQQQQQQQQQQQPVWRHNHHAASLMQNMYAFQNSADAAAFPAMYGSMQGGLLPRQLQPQNLGDMTACSTTAASSPAAGFSAASSPSISLQEAGGDDAVSSTGSSREGVAGPDDFVPHAQQPPGDVEREEAAENHRPARNEEDGDGHVGLAETTQIG